MSKTFETPQKPLDELLIIDPNMVTMTIRIDTKTGNIQSSLSKNNIFTPMQIADICSQITCQYVRQGILAEAQYQKTIQSLEAQVPKAHVY